MNKKTVTNKSSVLINLKWTLFTLTLFSFLSSFAMAEDQSKSGANSGFGGPTEIGHQLEEDNKEKTPLMHFHQIDKSTGGWKKWKHELYEDTGFQFGFDYTTL